MTLAWRLLARQGMDRRHFALSRPHRRAPGHRPSGFTLIEVVVVMAIMLVAVMIALPSFRGWVVQQQLRSAVARLEADLRLARMTAINENAPTAVRFGAAPGTTYQVFIDDGSGAGTARNLQRDGSERIVVSRTLEDGIVLSTVDFAGGVALSFNGRGLRAQPTAAAPANVVLRNSAGLRYQFTVSIAGNVDVARQ